MLYATNGRTQDLPPNTPFDFWSQVDWGIAFNIAKVEQNLLVGADRAPHQKLAIDLLLDAVMRDKWSVWKSRPRGQQANWEGWGNFCSYYLRMDVFGQQALLSEMIRGYVGAWFPKFLASGTKASGGSCFWYRNAPNIVYWDFHEFDRNTCRSVRQLPATWPTPQEIAMGKAYAQWWASLLGQNEAQKMLTSPPTAAERAQVASTPPQPNPPNLLLPDADEDAMGQCGPGERWNAVLGECEPSGARVLDVGKLTDDELAQVGSPFKTASELKAALEGPYREDICSWFNSMGTMARSELEALLANSEHSFEEAFGTEAQEKAAIAQWVVEAKQAWPELNDKAYERYLHCFYDGIYHPSKGTSSSILPLVVGGTFVGLAIWILTRRG